MRVPSEAFWIGSDHPFDLHETYVNFRKDFDLPGLPAEARLLITADSRYKLWINGTLASRGPARCWPHAQQVDVIDVTSQLVTGKNCIAVQGYSPGYSHFAYVHRGSCGLLAWLEADGRQLAMTDATWRVQRDLSWASRVERISIYGSGVERRDMALATDWLTAETQPPLWKVPRSVSPPEGPIWSNLRPRDIPLMEYKTTWFHAGTAEFRSGSGLALPDDPHDALRQIWQQSEKVPGRTDHHVHLNAGECFIWTIELHATLVGQAVAAVRGAGGGERLLISYAEKLNNGELVISDPQTYCRMRPTDEFLLRAGDQIVESFSPRGGRYLVFCLIAANETDLELQHGFSASEYPQPYARISGTSGVLAKVADLCQRTTLHCLQDGFVDSVWRESSQWLGDCVAQAFAFRAISEDVRPLRRAITMAADGAYEDGILPSVLPGEVHAYTVLDYNFSWVELLDMYVTHPSATDRQEFIAYLWPVLSKMLERFDADRNADGFIMSQPGRRLFLDWSTVDRREPSLTYNCRYLHALQLAVKLARWAGEEHSAAIWQARAARLSSAISATFHAVDEWCENTLGTPASQLGLALVLLCGLSSDEALCQRITLRSLDLDDSSTDAKLVLASPFMHHYIFQALEKLGHQQAILDIISARWGRWAAAGETTCWENWSIDFPDGSACHGFSAHPLEWIRRCQAALSR